MTNKYHTTKLIVFTLLLHFATSCSFKKSVTKQELLRYIHMEENGVTYEEKSLDAAYRITYKPNELIVNQILKAHRAYDADSLKNCYSDSFYFTLSLSQNDKELLGSNRSDFGQILRKVAFELNREIYLKDNDSEQIFYLADFNYPRLYASTGSSNILLCFRDNKLKELEDFTICVRDFINNSAERLKFRFTKQNINKIPSLKI